MSLPRTREDGKSKGKKKGLPEKKTQYCRRNSMLEVSLPNSDRKKMEINCGNMELCTKKTSSAVGCGRMWKEKNHKWKGVESGKRELEGEGRDQKEVFGEGV